MASGPGPHGAGASEAKHRETVTLQRQAREDYLRDHQRLTAEHAALRDAGEQLTALVEKLLASMFFPREWKSELRYPAEQMRAALSTTTAGLAKRPIPMLLFCPACGVQHLDAPEPDPATCHGCAHHAAGMAGKTITADWPKHTCWQNPPHKSHACHGCGVVWRPADVETVGVAAIATKGKADTWTPADLQARGEEHRSTYPSPAMFDDGCMRWGLCEPARPAAGEEGR